MCDLFYKLCLLPIYGNSIQNVKKEISRFFTHIKKGKFKKYNPIKKKG